MKSYDPSPSTLSPAARSALRGTLATAAACAYAFVVMTAGPGNGYQVPHAVQEVKLPTVVIVGKRDSAEPQQQQAVVDDGVVTCRRT